MRPPSKRDAKWDVVTSTALIAKYYNEIQCERVAKNKNKNKLSNPLFSYLDNRAPRVG